MLYRVCERDIHWSFIITIGSLQFVVKCCEQFQRLCASSLMPKSELQSEDDDVSILFSLLYHCFSFFSTLFFNLRLSIAVPSSSSLSLTLLCRAHCVFVPTSYKHVYYNTNKNIIKFHPDDLKGGERDQETER
jgi:hypothetical protein